VIFNGVLKSSTTPTVGPFLTPGNTATFTIANQVVSGITYVPSPSSGTSLTANVIKVVFTAQSSTCQISLSNSLIGFGGINPLSYAATANLVVDTNSGGVSANILVDGSNWISGANNFYVANGLWNPTSAGSGVGNALKLDPSGLTDTGIVVPASGSNDIYFGLRIPGAQPPGTYSANIVLENKC
jgi:hypothetical protein